MYVLSKSVCHSDSSEMAFYLNSISTHTESPYSIYLGPSVCYKIISLTVLIDPLTNLYWARIFFNKMTLHPMFDAVSVGELDSFKQ